MRPGRWHRPATTAIQTPEVEVMLEAVARAMDGPREHSPLLVERQRLAGRSDIYVVRSGAPGRDQRRLVVKQPHTGWSQDDVDSPLSAHQEFLALQRLRAHFHQLGVPFRVPTPVVYLPEFDAFVMEYVAGVTIKQLLKYGSAVRPATLLDGLTATGSFLRCVHALEELPAVDVDLRDEAQQILAVAEERLLPLGLSLPDRVRRTLTELPSSTVRSSQVWLHGDFGPANIILATDGSVVGLDPALSTVGHPEDDLVRFTVLVAGVMRLAPELVVRPVAAVRRGLENRLLHSYYQSPIRPPLFELKYLHQLVRRWVRLREMAEKQQGALQPVKLRVIGAQMRLLMADTERRLVRSIGGL